MIVPLSFWMFTNGVTTGVTSLNVPVESTLASDLAASSRELPAAVRPPARGCPEPPALGGKLSGDADFVWWRLTLPPLKAPCCDGGVSGSDSLTDAALAEVCVLPFCGLLGGCSGDRDRARGRAAGACSI